jgi:hypothetical protein
LGDKKEKLKITDRDLLLALAGLEYLKYGSLVLKLKGKLDKLPPEKRTVVEALANQALRELAKEAEG